jgi:ATP-dependent Clp protease ATP-binding subunit ClpA
LIAAYYREYSENKDSLFAYKFPPEFMGRIDKVIPFMSLSIEDYKVIVRRLAKKYNKNVDVDAIVSKNLPISERYGVRQFIKKAEEDILVSSKPYGLRTKHEQLQWTKRSIISCGIITL